MGPSVVSEANRMMGLQHREAKAESYHEGLPGIKGPLRLQQADSVDPPVPPLDWSFGYAAYLFNNTDQIDIVPNEPLTFNYFFARNITYNSTGLTVQNDGLYRISVAVNNLLLNSTVTANIWKNGVPLPDVSFVIEIGAPFGVVDGIAVSAKAGDYFELVVDVTRLLGFSELIAYSFSVRQDRLNVY
jgi:hypothetical protein